MKIYFLMGVLLLTSNNYLSVMAMEDTSYRNETAQENSLQSLRNKLINNIAPDIQSELYDSNIYSICWNSELAYRATKKKDRIVLTTNYAAPLTHLYIAENVEWMQWHANLLIVTTNKHFYLYNTKDISVIDRSHGPHQYSITSECYEEAPLFSCVKNCLALQLGDTIYVNEFQEIPIEDSLNTINVSESLDESIKAKSISALCLNPADPLILALGTSDGMIYLWHIQNKELIDEINTDNNSPITSLSFSSDGTYIAAVGHNSIFVVNTSTATGLTTTFDQEIHSSLPALWSPRNNYFTVILKNGACIVWSAQTQQCSIINSCSDSVTSYCWHPNDTYVAMGLKNGTIRIWEVQTKTCIQTLSPETNSSIQELHWNNQLDNKLAAVHQNGTMYLWHTKPLDAIAALHQKTTPSLLYDKFKEIKVLPTIPESTYAFACGLMIGSYGMYYINTELTKEYL